MNRNEWYARRGLLVGWIEGRPIHFETIRSSLGSISMHDR